MRFRVESAEEKEAKRLLPGCRRLPRDSRAKVFCSFFSKKNFLFFQRLP
jgi:hypothetical protein